MIDLLAGMGEGGVSAEGKGFSTEREDKPLGNALQTPWHPCTPQSFAVLGTRGVKQPQGLLAGEAQGWVPFPNPAPHLGLKPPHLLWPQALLHPPVLDAGDLVEEAAAVELQALVELAVGQPLPGEEGGLG